MVSCGGIPFAAISWVLAHCMDLTLMHQMPWQHTCCTDTEVDVLADVLAVVELAGCCSRRISCP